MRGGWSACAKARSHGLCVLTSLAQLGPDLRWSGLTAAQSADSPQPRRWWDTNWGGGGIPLRPRASSSQAPLTSPCPPSNHDLCTTTRIKYWDRAGGGRDIV